MITEAQQYRIHQGDETVFGEVYRANNMRVYHRARAALNDALAAKAVVIEAFTAFRAALLHASGPLDADALLEKLTGEAIERVDALRRQSPQNARIESQTVEPLAPPAQLPENETHDIAADGARDNGRRHKRNIGGTIVRLLLGVLFSAAFFWLLFGLLMRGGAMAYRDLGYSWFNENVLSHFNLYI